MVFEEWRDIPGFVGLYKVSNLGRIKSVPRNVKKNNTTKEHFIKPYFSGTNYAKIGLRKNNRTTKHYVHRLVAVAFLGNPTTEKNQIDHIDGNKLNNAVENLEWVSRKTNMQRAWKNGLCESCREASKRNVRIMNAKRRIKNESLFAV